MAAKKKSAERTTRKDTPRRRPAKATGTKTVTEKAASTKRAAKKTVDYALERLFNDQDQDFVIDCIAPVLA